MPKAKACKVCNTIYDEGDKCPKCGSTENAPMFYGKPDGDLKLFFKMVEEKITRNTRIVLNIAKKQKIKPRDAAMRLAQERVLKKCKVCNVQI